MSNLLTATNKHRCARNRGTRVEGCEGVEKSINQQSCVCMTRYTKKKEKNNNNNNIIIIIIGIIIIIIINFI